MANSQIAVTEGSGKNIASYSFTEDTISKQAQRIVLNNSSGTEITTLAVSMATNTPVGTVAHDAVDSGAPIKTGAKAVSTLSTATLVSAADRVDNVADTDGAQIVRNIPLSDIVSGNTSNTDGASTAVIAAQGSGIKVYLTDITITNTSTSSTYVEVKDGTTVKWTFPVPANGGVVFRFGSPIAGTANTAWNFDAGAATTTLYFSAAGFKSKI